MRVSRIVADWLADLIAEADAPIPTLCAAITDGDESEPDRITIVVSESVDPVAPPLHLYDITLEIRTPAASALTSTQHASVEAWLATVYDDAAAYTALETALQAIGTLHDWFVGIAGGIVRYESSIVTERPIRLAIVHS